MMPTEWQAFSSFRSAFKEKCHIWQDSCHNILSPLQQKAYQLDNVPPYPIENSVVYNTDLDSVTPNSQIKLILVGDNPGKNEQLNVNQKYLCGLAGKIAENYFKKNPELVIDFRKNVIILNKTPVHTAKTKELYSLVKYDTDVNNLINESQVFMAEQTMTLQNALNIPIWLIGYGEIKTNGIFQSYLSTMTNLYTHKYMTNYDKLFVFQHFSMNRFSIDFNDFLNGKYDNVSQIKSRQLQNMTLLEQLQALGTFHKEQIFKSRTI